MKENDSLQALTSSLPRPTLPCRIDIGPTHKGALPKWNIELLHRSNVRIVARRPEKRPQSNPPIQSIKKQQNSKPPKTQSWDTHFGLVTAGAAPGSAHAHPSSLSTETPLPALSSPPDSRSVKEHLAVQATIRAYQVNKREAARNAIPVPVT